MIILGISDSHESHACLLVDGVIVAAIAEERLSRLKTDSSYPKRAIESVIAISDDVCVIKPKNDDTTSSFSVRDKDNNEINISNLTNGSSHDSRIAFP